MFKDREEAGERLAQALLAYARENPVICALPRGGLPVAEKVARRLRAPLALVLVRKLGAPRQKELAIGAVVDGQTPVVVLHNDIIDALQISDAYIEEEKAVAYAEIDRRRKLYPAEATAQSVKGKTVILVDDGLATGATMEAAVQAMKAAGAARVVAAIPAAPDDTLRTLSHFADDIVCLETPTPFRSVGSCYRAFPQLTDADVIAILNRNRNR